MRAVIQRVSRASVTVEGRVTGRIERGFLILAGIAAEDQPEDLELMCDKIVNMRIFPDAEGKMNVSARDAGAGLLVVSQFTLYADCRKGRRPSFIKAAPPDFAARMIALFIDKLRLAGMKTESGVFGAMMDVELINQGPVTIILDSGDLKRPRSG
ncbi:MAG: D-aminoacyl-tRNA deacylase [Candidatus Sumerlaeota bacterium]|nr:D-aminoacyl-tRNA deacylase [Candidatus Sumerlaeota bacterium]